MQPLMDGILEAIRRHAPAPAEGSAICQVRTKDEELQRARAKLQPMD